MSLAFAGGTAGANPVVSSTINGSGSNTTYQMMIGLSDLFDQAPGCNLGSGVPEPLDLSCVVPSLGVHPVDRRVRDHLDRGLRQLPVGQTVSLSGTGVTATDSAGTITPTGDFSVASATGTTFTLNDLSGKLVTPSGTPSSYTATAVAQPGEDGETATMENPYNDVTYQEPAIGSGNGVAQLDGTPNNPAGTKVGNGDGNPTTTISYARSSSGPSSSTPTTLNYVAYALDGSAVGPLLRGRG